MVEGGEAETSQVSQIYTRDKWIFKVVYKADVGIQQIVVGPCYTYLRCLFYYLTESVRILCIQISLWQPWAFIRTLLPETSIYKEDQKLKFYNNYAILQYNFYSHDL